MTSRQNPLDAANLDDLLDRLNAPTNELSDGAMAMLPIYGGPEVDREGVWSWDTERLIVGIAQPFQIVTRAEYAAQTAGRT